MHRFKKIICLFLILVISSLPVVSQACGASCPMMKKEATKDGGMKCHKSENSSDKTSDKDSSAKKCSCDCGMCKTSMNSIKAIKLKNSYTEKFFNFKEQVTEKGLSYGIFNPPKFIS